MRFCLHVALPLSVDVGLGSYVLELVDSDSGDGCWLRARDCDDPVTFLLAHFPDRWEAGAALLTGFDVGSCPFHQRIMEQLVTEGRASRVQRTMRPVLLPHRRHSPSLPKVLVELSHN
jgi:hypothetical protein